MGRPRSFDEQAVLDAAAGQFRVRGFAETSTESLCEAAGVRRSSLYNTFDSKEELFVRALERYTMVTNDAQSAVLTDENLDGLARLHGLLDLIIGEEVEAAGEGHAAGCMSVSTYMTPDLRQRDERITRILDRARENQLFALTQAIRAGQRDGTLRADVTADEAALLVLTVISGLRISAQAGIAPETLQSVARLSLNALAH